jgi:peptide/nickel transport system substrate-binding protein
MAATIAILAMCGQVKAKQLTMLVQPEPTTLLAQVNTGSSVQIVATKIFDGLFNLSPDLELQPALALSHELSADGKTITLKLRPNVRWHDGKPFTSEDVRFTLRDVIKVLHPRGRAVLANLTEIQTPDELTAILKFSKPSLYVLKSLTGPEMPIMPAHVYAGSDVRENPAANAPIGTGPFVFDRWEKGSAIVLKANKDYWMKGSPKVDGLIIRSIPDPSSRSIALETGEVAVAGMNPVPLTELSRIQNVPGIKMTTEGYAALGGIMFFEFNTRLPKFQDLRVRKALAHAINRDFIAQNIWFGLGQPAVSPVPSWVSSFHDKSLGGYKYDKAEAVRLLNEAGLVPDATGIRLRITHDVMPFDENYARLARYIKQALAEVGVDVQLRNQDFPSWLKRVYTDYDYETSAYIVFATVDPTLGIQRLIWGGNISKGVAFSNASGFKNAKVDGLLEQAQVAATQEERIELWKQVQQSIMEELPVIPLIDVRYATLHQKNVEGIEADGYGIFGSFANVSFK